MDEQKKPKEKIKATAKLNRNPNIKVNIVEIEGMVGDRYDAVVSKDDDLNNESNDGRQSLELAIQLAMQQSKGFNERILDAKANKNSNHSKDKYDDKTIV